MFELHMSKARNVGTKNDDSCQIHHVLHSVILHDTRMLEPLDLAQQVVTLPLHHLLRFLSAI